MGEAIEVGRRSLRCGAVTEMMAIDGRRGSFSASPRDSANTWRSAARWWLIQLAHNIPKLLDHRLVT